MYIGQTTLDLSAKEAHDALERGEIVLVDVREPGEFASERIHGAMLFPLSTFDPALLPQDAVRPIVFHRGSGKRSLDALRRCAAAGGGEKGHLAGGMTAWKAARLPTVSIDPTTGKIRDRAR